MLMRSQEQRGLWRRCSTACMFAITVSVCIKLTIQRVRERLKEFFHQYELREKHFECVIKSKELEVLLSRARAEEQKQLAEKNRALFQESDNEVRAIVSPACEPRDLFWSVDTARTSRAGCHARAGGEIHG
jgi:hypothetical protein